MKNSSNVTEMQQMLGSWTTQLGKVYSESKVPQLMNTRIGQYLSSHPFFAVTLFVFSAMAALPVGVFVVFAVVTVTISAVGFLFFDMFLLFVAGVTLLCVLSGIALFALMVSSIITAVYITVTNVLIFYPHLTKGGNVYRGENGYDTARLKEMQ
ncbi:lipid droplet assembly factor 1-like [Aulostomus maculatus]